MIKQAQLVSIGGLQPSQNLNWPGDYRLVTLRLLNGKIVTTYAYDPVSLVGTGRRINNAKKWWDWIQANGSDYSTVWDIGIMLEDDGSYRLTTAKNIMGDGDVIPTKTSKPLPKPKNNPNNPPHINQYHNLFN